MSLTMPEIDFLNAVDFTPTIPCEHSEHSKNHADEPATYRIHIQCPQCNNALRYLICNSGRVRLLSYKIQCRVSTNACGYRGPGVEFVRSYTPL